jgi:hypothetical protein
MALLMSAMQLVTLGRRGAAGPQSISTAVVMDFGACSFGAPGNDEAGSFRCCHHALFERLQQFPLAECPEPR